MSEGKLTGEKAWTPPLEGREEPRLAGRDAGGSLAFALGQFAGSSGGVAGKARVLLAALTLAVGAFYLSTIRPGHEWGDDFSLYVLHAKNIAEGHRYQQTGYIHNPALALVGPQTYPPVFPLLLSPVYKLWGLNLTALKAAVVVAFLLSLIAIFMAFRQDLPWPYLISLLAVIGFNPYIWQFKDNIVSDLPFVLFVYLGLFLIHGVYQPDRAGGPRTLDVLLISCTIYLAYGARSIGLVLLPCLLAYDFIKHRKLRAFPIKVAVLTGLFVALQSFFLHSDRGYAGQIGINLGDAIPHAWEYASELSVVWAGESHKVFRLGFLAALSGLAIVGYIARVRRQITFFELFPVLYLAPLLVLPMPVDVRFLLPIIPLYLFYVFLGVRAISRDRLRESLVFLTLMAAISITYAARYAKLDYGPIREGIAKAETRQLFDYVRNQTGEGDVIIFRKPRAMALFTGRKASAWHKPGDDSELWSYFRRINATHLILGPRQLEPEDQAFFRDFVARHLNLLQESYANADFQVYRIKEMPSPRLPQTR